ncbi:hypothetical protein PSPO01_02665 [Paraphaeosphaeria sporulosa]
MADRPRKPSVVQWLLHRQNKGGHSAMVKWENNLGNGNQPAYKTRNNRIVLIRRSGQLQQRWKEDTTRKLLNKFESTARTSLNRST